MVAGCWHRSPASAGCVSWCWHSPRGAAGGWHGSTDDARASSPRGTVPFGSPLPAGPSFEAPDPRELPRSGQPPPEPHRRLRVSWAGDLPLAVPMSLQQQPLNLSAIPTGILDAQGGSRGCANTSWPHLVPLGLVTVSPGSHTGEGWAAQGSCHVQPCSASPLSPRSCWVAGTELGWSPAASSLSPLASVTPCPTAGGAPSPGEAPWCQAGLSPCSGRSVGPPTPEISGIISLLFAPEPTLPARAGPAWQGWLVSGALTLAQILLQAVPDV